MLGVNVITAIDVASLSWVTNPPQWSVIEQSLSWPLSPSVVEFVGSALGREIAKVMVMSAGVPSQTKIRCSETTPVLPMDEGFDESNDSRRWKCNWWQFMVHFGLFKRFGDQPMVRWCC